MAEDEADVDWDSASAAALLLPAPSAPFRFRARQASPDWRRLRSVDAGRVAAEADVAALQEHLEHVVFCSAERERCPACRAPAHPLLLRLLRLAQLSAEYLLASQDLLRARLARLARSLRQARARLAADAQRRRRQRQRRRSSALRAAAAQQAALLRAAAASANANAAAPLPQCPFCEKSFMNLPFLHSHLQRRHSEESHSDQKKKAQTEKLQEELNRLKDQLQFTRSQLEEEKQAHVAKLAKEYEEHRSKEDKVWELFHKWKEDEKEKMATELEKVKEMFMKEFKELTAKNEELENHLVELQKSKNHLKSNLGSLKDSSEFTEEKPQKPADDQAVIQLLEKQENKWASKVKSLQEEHDNEKLELLSQIEKLKASMTEDLNASNNFYKTRIEELGQRLEEQKELIMAQKYQIQKLATKSVENIKPPDVKASAQNVVQPKSSLPAVPEQALLVPMLEPIEELPEDEKAERSESKVGKNKHRVINSLKSNPSLTKELRAVLEQTLTEKLESLGIKAGVHGIPSDHLTKVLMSVESAREERMKEVPSIQHIRKQLEQQVSVRVAERASCPGLFSSPHLASKARQKTYRRGGSLSTVLPKPPKRSFIKRPTVQKTIVAENTSTSKAMKSTWEDKISGTSLSVTTPPFSSEDELEDTEIMHSYISPELSQPRASLSGSKNAAGARQASQSDDVDSLEEEEVVAEIEGNLMSSQAGAVIEKKTEPVGKIPLCQEKENPSSGEINVAPTVQQSAQGVKFTGVVDEENEDEDDDDWDSSSLEEEDLSPAKEEKVKNDNKNAVQKEDAVFVVHPIGKLTKEEGLQSAGTTSPLKNSLISIMDCSDSSDT